MSKQTNLSSDPSIIITSPEAQRLNQTFLDALKDATDKHTLTVQAINNLHIETNERMRQFQILSQYSKTAQTLHASMEMFDATKLVNDFQEECQHFLSIIDSVPQTSQGGGWNLFTTKPQVNLYKSVDIVLEEYKKFVASIYKCINVFMHIVTIWNRLSQYHNTIEREWLQKMVTSPENASHIQIVNKTIREINLTRKMHGHLPLIVPFS